MSSGAPNHTRASIATSALIVALAGCAPGPADAPPPDGAPDPDGALVYEQLDCAGWMGEAALLRGPDGTIVLWDVGNDAHADVVRDALRRHAGRLAADVTVITHFHADHGGALAHLGDVELGEVIARDDVPLRASNPDVFDALPAFTPLCHAGACALPRRVELGDGAALDLVAADGQALDSPFPGPLPDDDDGENARSIVGVVTWGDFTLVLPGDLTGGGKGTPDVEAHVAATLPAPLDADVLVLSHHGIDSGTRAAWIDRWLPDDGRERHALVGANGGYLDAPADEVLDRLRGRVADVWATRTGSLVGADPLLHVARGSVQVTVTDEGGRYTLADR